jgi:hypothetical protein
MAARDDAISHPIDPPSFEEREAMLNAISSEDHQNEDHDLVFEIQTDDNQNCRGWNKNQQKGTEITPGLVHESPKPPREKNEHLYMKDENCPLHKCEQDEACKKEYLR